MAVVRTARGVELGEVRTAPRDVAPDEVNSDLKPVERRATPEDLRRGDDEAREREALAAAAARRSPSTGCP